MAVLTTYKDSVPTSVSKGLSAGWVYYENLKEHNHVNLYLSIRERLKNIEEPHFNSKSVNKLLNVANKELKKEQNFLKTIFGVQINEWDYAAATSEKDIKDLLDSLNTFLNVPDVYQRCINRIKVEQRDDGATSQIVKITIAEFFPTYFEPLRKRYIEGNQKGSIRNLLLEYWENLPQNGIITQRKLKEFYNYADKVIEEKTEQVIRLAIKKMFESSDFNKGFKKHMQERFGDDTQAYKVMLDWIDSTESQLGGSKSFYQTVYDAYKFKDFKKELKNGIKGSFTLNKKLPNYINKSFTEKGIGATTTATGDVSEKLIELLTDSAYKTATETLRASGKISHNYEIKSLQTGKKGTKPDVVFVYEEKDTSEISNIVQEAYNNLGKDKIIGDENSKRVENIEAHEKLNENLKKANSGYLIYTNAKNYTINENFKGFHSGSKINLETFKNIMHTLNKTDEELDTFIGTIVNTINGAIGYKLQIKSKLERYLATDIAYFLFDDFTTIGEDLTSDSVNKLHLMNLDGIYIPLSFILYLLYKSFLQVENGKINKDISEYASATITPDPEGIKYPYGYIDDNGVFTEGKWGKEAWEKQKEYAFFNTRVGLSFLKSFRDIIKNWF